MIILFLLNDYRWEYKRKLVWIFLIFIKNLNYKQKTNQKIKFKFRLIRGIYCHTCTKIVI